MEKKVVVIAGPSGSGKNTVIRAIKSRFPRAASLTTATTRQPRLGEVEGEDYYFFSMDRFDAEASNIVGKRFVPLFGGVHYGIYLPDLKKKLEQSSVVLAPVDITGAEWLKEHYGTLTIFLIPESVDAYRARIRARSPEMPEREFDMRMHIAETELKTHAPRYDYRVLAANGGLTETVEQVMEILKKEGYTL
jgi:guanylate kinase